ncbi:MAG: signal peptidase II [Phycisphaerae bacterium]|nr:signal peptidase II [Phycisphaerae bacterium]
MTEPKTEQTSTSSHSRIRSRIRHFISEAELPGPRAQTLFWGLFVTGLVLDLWSKKAVFDRMDYGDSFTVVNGFLRLVPWVNNGAAFGICAGQPLFLAAASIIAMVVVLVYFYLWGTKETLVHISLGLLAAGICGNLYDRLFNEGAVRDFIDVYINIFGRERHWHTFNVADALLCIGVALLIIWTASTGKSDQKPAQQRK